MPSEDQEYCAKCDAPVFPPETMLNDEGVCNLCEADEREEISGGD